MKKLKILKQVVERKRREYNNAVEEYNDYCRKTFGIWDGRLIDAYAIIEFVEKMKRRRS